MRALFGLAVLVAFLDQALKAWMLSVLELGQSQPVLAGFFHLTLVHNTGGAFGLFAHKTVYFVLLSVATIAFLIWYYRKYRQARPGIIWPVGLVLGGAVGNLADRLRLGYVVDFLDFFAGEWHWPAFNLADSAICVGLGILAFMIGKGE